MVSTDPLTMINIKMGENPSLTLENRRQIIIIYLNLYGIHNSFKLGRNLF